MNRSQRRKCWDRKQQEERIHFQRSTVTLLGCYTLILGGERWASHLTTRREGSSFKRLHVKRVSLISSNPPLRYKRVLTMSLGQLSGHTLKTRARIYFTINPQGKAVQDVVLEIFVENSSLFRKATVSPKDQKHSEWLLWVAHTPHPPHPRHWTDTPCRRKLVSDEVYAIKALQGPYFLRQMVALHTPTFVESHINFLT